MQELVAVLGDLRVDKIELFLVPLRQLSVTPFDVLAKPLIEIGKLILGESTSMLSSAPSFDFVLGSCVLG